jgi:hypothetical protein
MSQEYTSAERRWLKRAYKRLTVAELTAAFNAKFGATRTKKAIKTMLFRSGYRSGRTSGCPRGTYRIFTTDQVRWLRKTYKRLPVVELSKAFNAKFGASKRQEQIESFVGNHRITSGRTGKFEHGNIPWNKGLKGVCTGGRSRETHFHKGNRPPGWKPIGAERITKDGYRQRKVTDTGYAPRDWVPIHRLIWIEERGPIPDGHVVIFVDGDKQNINIDNLACIGRAGLSWMNGHGYATTSLNLRPTAIAVAKLEIRRRELAKKIDG